MDKTLGLYLHIPFCRSKCAYCDFYSITDHSCAQRYEEALALHIEDYSRGLEHYTVDSVFLGGGTPTILPKNLLRDMFDVLYANFNVAENAEITVEANPATLDASLLRRLSGQGVNRLSIGLQSVNDNELAALSRIHTFADFQQSFELARKARFDNINVDLMYGIPGQTLDSFRHTLETVCALHPEHLSVYGLKIEEGTPFAKKRDQLDLPDEDTEYAMYEYAVEALEGYGYMQYEISNFAQPGCECRHNLKYWTGMEYLGLGPAAHSYLGGRRFSFVRDIDAYIDALSGRRADGEKPRAILDENYAISERERLGEYVMLRLRLNEGLSTADFAQRFGRDFERMYGKYLRVYLDNGFMQKRDGRYSFTTKGRYVSNYILSTMLDFDSPIANGIADGSDQCESGRPAAQ